MKRLCFVVGAALAAASPAYALTDAECNGSWTMADAKSAGVVTEVEAARYFAALRVANTPVADGKLTKALFLQQCKAGLFNQAAMVPGAPLKGANSFTAGQVKDRLIAWGYTNVAGLKQDSDGVWRGTASDGAKSMNVAVDFKGNIVAN